MMPILNVIGRGGWRSACASIALDFGYREFGNNGENWHGR
jgi:hypothetical protein